MIVTCKSYSITYVVTWGFFTYYNYNLNWIQYVSSENLIDLKSGSVSYCCVTNVVEVCKREYLTNEVKRAHHVVLL